jgi:prefoldin subunit 5
VASGVRAANAGIKKAAADIDAATAELAQFSQLPAVEQLLKTVADCDKKIAAISKDFNRLRQLEADMRAATDSLRQVTATEADCERAAQLAAEIRKLDPAISKCEVDLQSLKRIDQQISILAVAEIDTQVAVDDYVKALQLAGICDRCYGKIDSAAIERIKGKLSNE